MPLKKCSVGGESGWKWGDAGKCYTGEGAKQNAIRQALAIGGGKMPDEGTATATTKVRKRVGL